MTGDMWSLGVLMYVVLTGAVPPFAHSLAHSRCRGMCADALQATVSAALRHGLDASQPRSPIPRGAMVSTQLSHRGLLQPQDLTVSANAVGMTCTCV